MGGPGVLVGFVAKRDERAIELFRAIVDNLPAEWSRVPVDEATETMCRGIGISTADWLQVVTPAGFGTRPLRLTVIRNSFSVELVSILPDERRYEDPLSDGDAAEATGAFVIACVKPHLTAEIEVYVGTR